MLLQEVRSMTLTNPNLVSQSDYSRTTEVAGRCIGNHSCIVQYPSMMPCRIDLQDANDTGRQALEEFIHHTFKRAYGANVQHFLPRLMSLKNHQDNLLAAVGFHAAKNDPLFLEQYLDNPVEGVLSEKLGCHVQRRNIMEIGNLAVASAGGARGLIIALTSYIKGAGFDWVVFTAVPSLVNSFKKMELEIIPLMEAKKERLINGRDQWGSYYNTKPIVVAGNVRQGYEKLEQLLTLEHKLKIMRTLWNHAYAAGYKRRKGYQFIFDNTPAS